MGLDWYAIHSKPNKEMQLWDQLLLHDLECYYPRLKVKPVNPRARKIRPYFPGYLFIHVDLKKVNVSAINWMPFTTGLISFDGKPFPIAEAIINSLRQRIGDLVDASAQLAENLNQGDVVVIQEGPLRGFDAIFDARLPGTDRVQLLLKLLGGQHVRLLTDLNMIQKKK